jgi:hypothetical protein
MTGGRTNNFINCKDCKTENKNIEDWSMLCVPIPESFPFKKIGIELIPWQITE